MRLDTAQRLPRLLFTETGLMALRTMMMDRRLADPNICPCSPGTRHRSLTGDRDATGVRP